MTLLVVAAALLGAWACERRATPPASLEAITAAREPDQESWATRYFVSEGGRPRVHLVADYMQQFSEQDSSYMLLQSNPDSLSGRVRAYFFGEAGDSTGTLTADRIYYYDQDQRFEARGNVVVVTQEGKRLESEHLLWDEKARKVRTAGFVRITTPKERIQGYNLVADEDLETYELGRVTADLTVEDS